MRNLQTNLFMFIGGLKEEKNKKYVLNREKDTDKVYIFKNIDEMYNYYHDYGFNIKDDSVKEALDLTVLAFLRNGNVVCLRDLCDYVINKKNMVEQVYYSKTKENIKK